MHFLPLEEARTTLSDQKATLEAERKRWLTHQSITFQQLYKDNQNAVDKQWHLAFVIILLFICFVINAVISLSLFFILEKTVYADAIHVSTQGARALRALYSTLILPALFLIYALIHNMRWKERSPNQTRLTLVRHPDYPVWVELDEQFRFTIQEINTCLDKLSHRGLLYIDGEMPADPSAVLGTLYVDGERVTDLTYNEMPYEFHLDEGIYRIALKSGTQVLFEQAIHLRHVYVATLDITGNPAHPNVDMQNMMCTLYREERAKMSRKGTAYAACDQMHITE
jgi:hypothetical protein